MMMMMTSCCVVSCRVVSWDWLIPRLNVHIIKREKKLDGCSLETLKTLEI